uniref:AcrIC8 n=1 Tax=Rhodobacter phage RcNL1 TaxID=754047 RepID=UPI003003A77E
SMYAIRKIQFFYGPTDKKSYVGEEAGGRRELFKTRAEAQARIEDLEEGVYYLAHNESGRPDYKIVWVRGE